MAAEEEPGAPDTRLRLTWNVYGYAMVASFSSFVYGYNTGIIAPAIIFIPKSIPMSVYETSAVVSVILIGAAFGSLLSGILSDWFGRKRILAYNNVLMLAAAVTAALGDQSSVLIASRLILGLGVGVASVVPGLYITEISPAHVRGKLGAVNQLCGWMGIVVSYFIGYEVVLCTAGSLCWRYMFASGAVLCILHWLLVTVFIPDTPRWLVNQGRSSEAVQVLSGIYGDEHDALVVEHYQSLCVHQSYKEPIFLTLREACDRRNRRPLLIALLMQIIQQASGNSAIVYYSTMVFHSMGFSARSALLYNAVACIPQLIVLIGVVFALDRQGRRPSLLVSEAGVVVSLLILGAASTLDQTEPRFWALLGGIVMHRAFFAAGLGPVPTVLISETLPFLIRGRGLAGALSFNWLANFFVTATFPYLFSVMDPQYIYWTFAAFSLLGFFLTLHLVRETKGASLEELEQAETPSLPATTLGAERARRRFASPNMARAAFHDVEIC